MATPVESQYIRKDPRGFSGLDESQLEKSIIRRGLATPPRSRPARSSAHRWPAKEKEDPPPRACWRSWSRPRSYPQPDGPPAPGGGGETSKKIPIPGYQVIRRSARARWASSTRPSRSASTASSPSRSCSTSLAQNKEFIKRFEREAKIAARLSHNNIVNAIDAGEVDGHYFFVMEYVEGVTIKDSPRQA